MAQRKPQQRNVYADKFAELYLLLPGGMPYDFITVDWVQLDRLLSKSNLSSRMTPEVWERGCVNYFASEVSGGHTLRHLCSKFVPYWRGPMNRFGQPRQTNGTSGMRTAGEVSGLPWPIRFLQKMNAIGKAHPEKTEALHALLDEIEGLDETTAMRRLAEISETMGE